MDRNQDADEVEHFLSSEFIHYNDHRLSYVGQDATRIPPIFGNLYGTKAVALDMSFNCLCNLSGLEKFVSLKELILDNNELSDSIYIPLLQTVHTFSLNNNKITDLERIIHRVKYAMPNLRFLSLLGNKACPNQLSDYNKDDEDYERYRYFVIHHLPRLKFLDSTTVTNHERKISALKGQYMKIRRPKESDSNDGYVRDVNNSNLSPLPSSCRRPSDHQGAYGKCRFRYSGTQSEGNRFIVNSDL